MEDLRTSWRTSHRGATHRTVPHISKSIKLGPHPLRRRIHRKANTLPPPLRPYPTNDGPSALRGRQKVLLDPRSLRSLLLRTSQSDDWARVNEGVHAERRDASGRVDLHVPWRFLLVLAVS